MKHLRLFAVVLTLAVLATGCRYVSPDPGTEAVLVEKPFLFGHGGVVRGTVKPGTSIEWLSTEAWHIDLRPQTYEIHFDDMMSKDGVPLDFNTALRVQITDPVMLVEKFDASTYDAGGGKILPRWFGSNVLKPYETAVRQAVRKHGMNETAIDTTAIDAIDAEISGFLVKHLKDAGLPVTLLDMTVGRANPPDSVKDQRIATAAQQQRIQTEQQRKLAEDQRRAAELARAEADNAYRSSIGLSPSQFIELERVKAIATACATGKCTVLAGQVPVVVGQ